jgi:transcriptional regulator with XRE-family HTH domain
VKRRKRGPTPADVQVGQAIRARRIIANMSQQELANRIGVSFQQVQKYEKGTNRVGAGRLPLIAEIFSVPINELFGSNADAGGVGAAPVSLIPDKATMRLLHAFAGVNDRAVRNCLIDLIGAISKSKPKHGEPE